MKQPIHYLLLLFITIIIYSLFSTFVAQPYYPSANISTKWTNSPSLPQYTFYEGNVTVRVVLLRGTSGPVFGCGFFCSGSCKSLFFSIFIVYATDGDLVPPYEFGRDFTNVASPRTIWSANRDRTVQENATLEFSQNGNLILVDVDGTQVWSTDTSVKSVVRMGLNQVGSLVLFDEKNDTVWSSMDHPTDTLVLGQSMKIGQRLTANVSITNSSQGSIYLTITRGGLQAFVGSLLYSDKQFFTQNSTELKSPTIVQYVNGSLSWFDHSGINLPMAQSVQYIQLDYRGHLRVYESSLFQWALVGDALYIDDCGYPTACGEYGICYNGQCTCPPSTFFSLIDVRNPTAGCKPSTAISCKSNKTHQFIYLPSVSYIGDVSYSDPAGDYVKHNLTEETCKEACMVNCSCKAAFFRFDTDASSSECYLPSEMHSLMDITLFNSSAFIKVQSLPIANSTSNSTGFSKSKNVNAGVIVGASVGSLLALFLIVELIIALVRRRSKDKKLEGDDEFIMLY